MKILVVDEECFVAELVRLALEADGHDCHTAATLEAASKVLDSCRIDLLTLDLVVDGRNPIDWLEEVALSRPELHGRIFIMTEQPLAQDELLKVSSFGAHVLHKPFTLQQLRETVRLMAPPEPRPARTRGTTAEAER